MKRKEAKQEKGMTAEGRKEKRREETGRPNSRPDPAGSATRAKDRRILEAPGKSLYYWMVVHFKSKTRFHITCQNVEDETSRDEAK